MAPQHAFNPPPLVAMAVQPVLQQPGFATTNLDSDGNLSYATLAVYDQLNRQSISQLRARNPELPDFIWNGITVTNYAQGFTHLRFTHALFLIKLTGPEDRTLRPLPAVEQQLRAFPIRRLLPLPSAKRDVLILLYRDQTRNGLIAYMTANQQYARPCVQCRRTPCSWCPACIPLPAAINVSNPCCVGCYVRGYYQRAGCHWDAEVEDDEDEDGFAELEIVGSGENTSRERPDVPAAPGSNMPAPRLPPLEPFARSRAPSPRTSVGQREARRSMSSVASSVEIPIHLSDQRLFRTVLQLAQGIAGPLHDQYRAGATDDAGAPTTPAQDIPSADLVRMQIYNNIFNTLRVHAQANHHQTQQLADAIPPFRGLGAQEGQGLRLPPPAGPSRAPHSRQSSGGAGPMQGVQGPRFPSGGSQRGSQRGSLLGPAGGTAPTTPPAAPTSAPTGGSGGQGPGGQGGSGGSGQGQRRGHQARGSGSAFGPGGPATGSPRR